MDLQTRLKVVSGTLLAGVLVADTVNKIYESAISLVNKCPVLRDSKLGKSIQNYLVDKYLE